VHLPVPVLVRGGVFGAVHDRQHGRSVRVAHLRPGLSGGAAQRRGWVHGGADTIRPS